MKNNENKKFFRFGFFMILALGCLLALLVSGCAPEEKTSDPLPFDRSGNGAETGKETAEEGAIDLVDLDGERFRLSEYRGKKVYIKFWASWCPVCLQRQEELEALSHETDRDFEVVTVVSPGYGNELSLEDFRTWFAQRENNDFRVLLDEDGKLVQWYGIRGYPTSFFVDPNGSVKVFQGDLSSDMIHQIFASDLMNGTATEDTDMNKTNSDKRIAGETRKIYLAGGCFWGVEAYFERIPGVVDAISGYANGKTENPSYEDLIYRNSGHAETVEVTYDPAQVSLNELLRHYFRIINPVSLNRQGNDVGSQYRTGIYYTDEADIPVIEARIAAEQENYEKKIAVEVKPLDHFYHAEDYHQDYLTKNPNGYCHIDLNMAEKPLEPEAAAEIEFQKPDDAALKATLSPEVWNVVRENGTERPYSSPLWDEFGDGIYVDIVTGEPLFSSADKFDAGCGWPSFSKPISEEIIVEREDTSHGMVRTEVRSLLGDAHLGHVFEDGPREAGGLRYCINGASLRFVPLAEMEAEGYGAYLKLFE